MRHLGTIADLSSSEVIAILDHAEEMRLGSQPPSHRGRVLTLAFFQSSTRTRMGFASAAIRLGFGTMDLVADRQDASMSSAESLSDTIRAVSAYSDALVLRHTAEGAWAAAVAHTRCPLINGGNGNDEHPTQALIDLFAIRRARGRLDDLRVGIVGDIRGSRSAHSLIKALVRLGQREIRVMGPESLLDGVVATRWFGDVRGPGTVFHELTLCGLDVLYVAGLPAVAGDARIDQVERARFTLAPERLRNLPEAAVILCPLPRIDEIEPAVDKDARSRYFGQSDDGVFLRMAVLEWTRPSEEPSVIGTAVRERREATR
jgi:aspartate carbamoyltransferase catalytic subunit